MRGGEVVGWWSEGRWAFPFATAPPLNHSTTGRRLVPFVVVGDDQVHATLACNLRLLNGGDAAVDGDDELRAFVAELGDCLGVEAVAFVHAVGNVELDLAAQC